MILPVAYQALTFLDLEIIIQAVEYVALTVPLAHADIFQHFHARYVTDEKHDCGFNKCLNSSMHIHNAPLCGCKSVRMHHTFMCRFSDRDVVYKLAKSHRKYLEDNLPRWDQSVDREA